MRPILIIAFLILPFSVSGQDALNSRLSNPTITHISTHGYFALDSDSTIHIPNDTIEARFNSSELTVLSPVDSDGSVTANWNKFTEKYKSKNYLLVVTRNDAESKLNFVTCFYGQRNKGFQIRKSYRVASRKFKDCKDLKHFLSLAKRNE